MKTLNIFRNKGLMAILISASVLTACSDDDDDDVAPVTPPPVENEEEVITDVRLIFTNVNDSTDVSTALAQDPDGDGPLALEIKDSIVLKTSTAYVLTYEILNAVDPNDVEDIGEEITEEDDEHQIFYGFSANAFSDPSGTGNIFPNAGNINYLDEDSEAQDGSGNPVGLLTSWTTAATPAANGTFRVVLMHQPDVKSATSTTEDGEDDFDLIFELDVE